MRRGVVALVVLMVLGVSIHADAKQRKKVSYEQAKRQCLSEEGSLNGKSLRSCIKKKRAKVG